jgi:DNA-directed RNA polymerase beta' subunit
MKIDVLPADKFIEVNGCPQVTNPIFLDSTRHPTQDGLFSYTLFGLSGSYDRKTIFGYIDLKKPFLHPVVYKMITSMDKKVSDLIAGIRYFKVENKQLVESSESEGGRTGISFLYEQWDNIEFKETGSKVRENKIDLLKSLGKAESFMTKQIVIPAFYRDINLQEAESGKISHDTINELYAKVLSAVSSLNDNIGFEFIGAATENRIQNTIVEIYEYLTGKQTLAGKKGIIHKSLLGKNIDYATRSVISAPKIDSNHWKKQQVRYTHSGIPMAQAANLFFPFVVREIQELLSQWFEAEKRVYHVKLKDYVYLKDPMEEYTLENIKKIVNLFIKSPEDRFTKLYVKTDVGLEPMNLFYNDIHRPLTITDLLYMALYECTRDKHVYVTRYPVEHHQNIYPSKVKVISTVQTKRQKIGHMFFEEYPTIYDEYPVKDSPFIDTAILNNSMLAALGGDYDGDTISIRGVFSQEANKEANDIIFSKKHLLDGTGRNSRVLQKEAILTLYRLTKD